MVQMFGGSQEAAARDRKVAESEIDSRTGNSSLCPWEKKRLFPLGPNNLSVAVASQTMDLQMEP